MIYFVRHGQTYDNAVKPEILSGHNKVKLTKAGIQQAKQTAEELKDVKFDVCFCSPLKRAKQTLKQIKKYHKKLKVVYDVRIMERDYGEITNKPVTVCEFRRWNSNDSIPFEMETIQELFNRVGCFYNDINQAYKGKNVLVVSHSGVARMSYFFFNGKPEDGDWTNFYLKNAEIMKLNND